MNYGLIEIRNEGTATEPLWRMYVENGSPNDDGFLYGHNSLDGVLLYLRGMREQGHAYDGIALDLEPAD